MAATVQQKNSSEPEASGTSKEQQQAKAQERSPAPQPVAANLRALEQAPPKSELNARIEQHISQRHKQQDQQELYASVWSGLAAALIKTQPAQAPSDFRRRVEQLVQELTFAEERERKRKRGARDDTFFRSLVTLVGEKEAASIVQKIEALQKSSSTSPQNVAQLAKDIASKLAAGDSILSLHTGTQSVERTASTAAQPREVSQKTSNVVPTASEPLDIRHPLNHPVKDVRDALVQMAQPNINPSRGHVTLPEMEPIARQLFPAAKNLGFSGNRDQFTEALYMLSHRVENGQGMRAEEIHQLTQQTLSEQGQLPSPHLVSIVTDLLARVQYAKAASINEGEVAHFVLRDGAQPAQVQGRLLADNAAQVLEATGGFGQLGAHGFGEIEIAAAPASQDSAAAVRSRNLEAPAGPAKIKAGAPTAENLSHNPDIALPENSAAPAFKVSTLPELTKQLKELGLKAAAATVRGDIDAARAIETEASDTLHDNKELLKGRSSEEQAVLRGLSIQSKAAELQRLEGIKAAGEKSLESLKAELVSELAEKASSNKTDREQAAKLFRERSSEILAKLDPAAADLLGEASRGEAAESFLKALDRKVAEVAEADRKAIEQETAAAKAKIAESIRIAIGKAKANASERELAEAIKTSAGQASAELEKRLQEAPELRGAFARNPEAERSLREAIATEQKKAADAAGSLADFMKRAETDLQGALQFNPVVGTALLEGPQGAGLLQRHLGRLKGAGERIAFLSSLKISLGSEKLGAVLDAYDKTTGRPLALDIVEMSQGKAARRDAFARITAPDSGLLTPVQRARLVEAVQRDYALTQAVIKEELKHADATLDANAKKLVEARNHLGELLGKKDSFEKLSDAEIDAQVLAAVGKKYDVPPPIDIRPILPRMSSAAFTKNCLLPAKESHRDLDLKGFDFAKSEAKGDFDRKKLADALQPGAAGGSSKLDAAALAMLLKSEIPQAGTVVAAEAVTPPAKPLHADFDVTLKVLRSKAGQITIDANGDEQYAPGTPEEGQAVQVIARLREIQALREHSKELHELKKKGVDGELQAHAANAKFIYGEALTGSAFGAERERLLEEEATAYLSGLKGRMSREVSPAQREKLIAERDAVDLRVASARISLQLDSENPQPEAASQLLKRFLSGSEPPRSRQFAARAERGLEAMAALQDYAQKALQLTKEARPVPVDEAAIMRSPNSRANSTINCHASAKDTRPNLDFKQFDFYKKGDSDLKKLADALQPGSAGGSSKPDVKPAVKPGVDAAALAMLLKAELPPVGSVTEAEVRTQAGTLPKGESRQSAETEFAKQISQTEKLLLGELMGRSEAADAQLLTPGKQYALRLGGTADNHRWLEAEWHELREGIAGRRGELSSASAAHTGSFLAQGPQKEKEALASASAARINEVLATQPSAPLTEQQLDLLRKAAPEIPELQAVVEQVPVSSAAAPISVQEQSRQLLARLSPEDERRVRLFVLQQEQKGAPAKQAWASIKKLDEQALAVELDAAQAEGKVQGVRQVLEGLSADDRARVEARFAEGNGQSIGAALIASRPLGQRGQQMLQRLSGTTLVTSQDLQPFFPAKAEVPKDPAERAAQLAKLMQADAKVVLASEESRKRFEETTSRQATTRGHWTAVLQVAGRNGDRQLVERARAEIAKLDTELSAATEQILGRHAPDYIARSGHREMFRAMQQYSDQSAASASLASDSKYATTVRRIAESLREATPNHVKATELLRKGSLSEAESALVRVLYAEHVSVTPVSDKERRLSGRLAQDLSTSQDPDHPETKRAELLARGGPGSLTDADIMLARDAMARGDKRDTLRSIVALTAMGMLEKAEKLVESMPPEAKESVREAQEYVHAVKNNDTVKQAGYELKSGLETGVATTADALASVQGMAQEGREKLGSVPGLKEAMGEYAPAWEKIVTPGTYEEGVKLAAETGAKLKDTDAVISSFSLMPEAKMGELISHLNRGLQPGQTWIDVVRQRDGWKGFYDASLLEHVQQLATNGKALSPEQLGRIRAIKESLAGQMDWLDALHVQRKELNGKSQEVWNDVDKERQEASVDYDNSPILRQVCAAYGLRVQNHRSFLANQNVLISLQKLGLGDIQQTKRIVAVMGVVMVEDIVTSRKQGIGLSHIETERLDLKRRDLQRDCWVVVRPEQFKEWKDKDREYRDSIQRWEIGAEVAHCAAKLVVIAAISATPGGLVVALAVSTAWNVGDKVYRHTVNGESLESVATWGAVELACDLVSFGVASKVAYTVRASAKLGDKVVEETVKGTTRAFGKKATEEFVARAATLAKSVDDLSKLSNLSKPIVGAVKEAGERVLLEAAKDGTQWTKIGVEFGKPGRMYSLQMPNFFSTPAETPTFEPAALQELKLKTEPKPIPAPAIPPKPTVEEKPIVEIPTLDFAAAQQKVGALVQEIKDAVQKSSQDALVAISTLQAWVEAQQQRLTPEQFQALLREIQAGINYLRDQAKAVEPTNVKEGDPKSKADEPQNDGSVYGDFGGLFQPDIFAFLNTRGIFNFNSAPIFVAPNIPPPTPPVPPFSPDEKASSKPPPRPPRPPAALALSPSANDNSLNTYVLEVMREQQATEAKARADVESRAEAARNQDAHTVQVAVANQQQAAQQQAAAVRQAQEREQAVAEQEAAVQREALTRREAIAIRETVALREVAAQHEAVGERAATVQREVVAQREAAAQGDAAVQQRLAAAPQVGAEPVRLRESSWVTAASLGESAFSLNSFGQQATGHRAQQEVEHLARAALVESPQGREGSASDSALRHAQKAEEAVQREKAERRVLTEAQQRSEARRIAQETAQQKAEQALAQEAERLVAQRSSETQRAPEALRAADEDTVGSSARQAPHEISQGSSQAGAWSLASTTLDRLEAAAQEIEASEQEAEQLIDEARKARKAKALRAKTRLREILMHQLQSMLFEQGKKDRMLRLLIALGISEKEYRELVAKIGEMEAQAMAGQQEGRKQAIAVEREAPRLKADSSKIAVTPSPGKSSLRMKEPEAAPQAAQKAQASQASRVSRAELYVRMKE